MRRLLLSVAIVLAVLGPTARGTRADTTWYPGSSDVGLDTRFFGMGGACLGVIDPRFYPANPAGLPFLAGQEILAGRFVDPSIDPVEMSGDQSFLHLAYAHPDAGAGAYGIGAYQNRYFETDRRWDLKVFQYGYGCKIGEKIGLGFSLRPVARTDEGSGAAETFVTFDAGAVFRLNQAVTAAVLLADINSAPQLLFGGSLRFGDFLLLAVDVDSGGFTNADELLKAARIGVEIRPIPPLALRAGSFHGRNTMGFGLRLGRPGLQLDLDFAQYLPENGAYANASQAMGMTVYF